jgi:hypothetical protein
MVGLSIKTFLANTWLVSVGLPGSVIEVRHGLSRSFILITENVLKHFTNASFYILNPLNTELNPICYLLALLAHHFLHVGRIRVKSINLTLLMSYIYGAHILDVSRSHTTTHRNP